MMDGRREVPQFYCRRGGERSYAKQVEFFAATSRKGNVQAGLSPGLPQCSQLQAPRVPLLGERFYGRCFVVLHIEDGVELRDLQQVVYFLGEVEQLEFAALVFGGGEGADQLADA